MRLLHTSDWHLGRSLHRADLRTAQSRFLDHLVEVVRSEQVDLVLVSGDIYDRAVPSVDAVQLCEEALLRLHSAGARVVLISGNHDSARRLGFGSKLLDVAGVHLRTQASGLADPVMLEDRHGPVAVYGIPYLEPAAVRGELGLEAGEGAGHAGVGHAAVMRHAVRSVHADADARGVARRVVLSHSWVIGGAACESERDITPGSGAPGAPGASGGLLGGAGHVPAALFDGFSYTALGHLHGRQTLGPGLRYSGSPLPYSFSEATHRKGSWLVELDAAGQVEAELVPAPVFRQLRVLSGTLGELLGSPAYSGCEDDFISVTLTDQVRPEAAMDALRTRFPHVLVLSYEPSGVVRDGRDYRARVAGRDDLSIAAEFVQHVRNGPVTSGERSLLSAAFAAAGCQPGDDC
jgi:DNA repair protein SbcD/Mre11